MKDKRSPSLRFNDSIWEQRKLEEVCSFYSGLTYSPDDVLEGNGTLVIRSSNISEGRFKFDNNVFVDPCKATSTKVQEGDVVVVVRNGSKKLIGKHAQIKGKPEEMVIGAFMTGIRGGKTSFINALLDTTQFSKEVEKNQGATINQITTGNFRKFTFYFPGEEEQEKIGAFFSKLDDTITLHQRKLEKLKKLKQGLLQKLFPKNDSQFPELRFPEFTAPWEQRKLNEIATMNARIGWQNLRRSEFLSSGDYLLITGTDFVDGKVNFSTCSFVDKDRYDQDEKIKLNPGSILLTKDGTLGKVAYISDLPKPATLNAGVFNIRVKDDTTSPLYLFHYLKAPFLLKYVDANATGGTIKHLNQSILVSFTIPFPSKEEQEKIGNFFEELDETITLHQHQLETLQHIKNAFLTKMFPE